MKKAKNYNKLSKSNKAKKQEKHLPLLVLTDDIRRKLYSDKLHITTRQEKLGMRGLGKRLERDLLRIPEFQPPYTTVDKPARLLSYEVVPEPDERGVFTAFIEVIPGYKADEYFHELPQSMLKASQDQNAKTAKR